MTSMKDISLATPWHAAILSAGRRKVRSITTSYRFTSVGCFSSIGRVTNVTWTAGTNAAVSTTYKYDPLNRITNVTSDAGSFGYAYLTNGLQVKTLTYPNSETANYTYDGLRRLTNLLYKTSGGAANGQWAYGYNSRDQVVTRGDPATNNYNYRYDEVGRLVEATGGNVATNATGYPFRYTYDWAGNRARQTEGTQTRSFAYNANNQVLSVGRSNEASIVGYVNEAGTCTVVEARATGTGAWQHIPTKYISYTQGWFEAMITLTNAGTNTVWIRATDKAGNTSTQIVHVVNSTTNFPFRYDLDGNQTNLLAGVSEWDAENRLVRIAYSTNASTRLRYDGLNRLREIAEYGTGANPTNVVRYAWNGMLPWAELDGSNNVLRTFTWGLDLSGTVGGAGGIGGLVGMRSRQGTGTNYLVRTDAKGNVTEVRQTDGTVVATYAYAPFGNIITNTGSYNQPFAFQSKIRHAKSNLGYWGERWYDYKTGRWISRDSLGEAGGINIYEYCGGSPLVLIDPTGLDSYSNYGFAITENGVASAISPPRGWYFTPRVAGIAAWYKHTGFWDWREKAGLIYKQDDACANTRFTHTPPGPPETTGHTFSRPWAARPLVPTGAVVVGAWHTHPLLANWWLSPEDGVAADAYHKAGINYNIMINAFGGVSEYGYDTNGNFFRN